MKMKYVVCTFFNVTIPQLFDQIYKNVKHDIQCVLLTSRQNTPLEQIDWRSYFVLGLAELKCRSTDGFGWLEVWRINRILS